MTPAAAQVDLRGVSGLEYDLLQKAAVIGSIYAVVVLAGVAVGIAALIRWSRNPPDWREAVAVLLARPVGARLAWLLFAIVIASLAALTLVAPWIPRAAPALGISTDSALVLFQSASFHGVGLAAIGALLASRRIAWRDAFGMRLARAPGDVVKGLLILLGSMPVLLLFTLVYHAALQMFGLEPSLQDVVFAMTDETAPWMRVYFVVLAALLAPFVEEVLFRGVLLPALSRRFGVVAASIAVSMIFAGIHGHIPSFMPLFILSMAMCAGYALSGSLTTAIAMHGLFNAMTVTILMTLG